MTFSSQYAAPPRVSADATSSIFWEVALCPLRLLIIGGIVSAAETGGVGRHCRRLKLPPIAEGDDDV